MTSQRWLWDSDRPVWWHFLAIITPANVNSSSKGWITLVLGQGSSLSKKVHKSDSELRAGVAFAVGTGSVAAVLLQVPNNPMRFAADGSHKHRDEESMRAWAWRYSIDHKERTESSLEGAVLKAAVRAFDTLTEVTGATNYVIAGLSKRGIGAWMAGAADARVKAIISGCHELDLLGEIHHVHRSFGGLPVASTPYHKELDGADEEVAKEFFRRIDPYYFLDRLKGVDKFVMAAGNDDMFLVDHSRSWWDLVEGPKTYLMRPNKRHTGSWHDDDFLAAAVAFAGGVVFGKPKPVISWEFAENGTITAWRVSGPKPVQVSFWTAATCPASPRRDFRKVTGDKGADCEKCGVPLVEMKGISTCLNQHTSWVTAPLTKKEDGGRQLFIADVKAPDKGWKAGFIEFSFAGDQKATTTVSVSPNTYPFPDCKGFQCGPSPVML